MSDFKEILKTVKSADWATASISFFVVKRRLIQRSATYEVMQVNIDDNLRRKIRQIAKDKINASNEAFEYDFNTADLDNNLLGIMTSETDFQNIIDSIQSDQEPPFADSYESLLDSWLYVGRLDLEGTAPLFSARRISESWGTKKVFQLVNMIFTNNMLVDLEQQEIFRIDGKVDFFAFNGAIFIADKKNFETVLNFREGMERNRDQIVEDFKTTGLFVDADEVSRLVGDNIRRLRKLSQVKKAGYFTDPSFLSNLKRVSDDEAWGIQYSEDGKLIVTEDDIDTVLKVLNNDRLKSPINQENFDVDVKHKLGRSQPA